jgi:hypothetical protein
MNIKIAHVLAAVLFSAGQSIQFLSSNPAVAAQMHVTATILTTAAFLVALASQQLFGTPTPPNPNALDQAAKVLLLAIGFAGLTCLEACGPTAPPLTIANDVVKVDEAACKLEQDLGGPTVTLLCPFGTGPAMAKVAVRRETVPRLLAAAAADAGAQ